MPTSPNRHIDLKFHMERKSMVYHEVVADMAVKYSSPGAEIMDLGTGAGGVPFNIERRAPDRVIDTCDAYQECLDLTSARANVRNAYLIDEQRFDITDKIANTYDVVTMSHVLEHLRDPVTGVFDALSLVRPGGHLVLAVPNPVRPSVIVNSLLKRRYSNQGHVVAWDRSHWMNFLENILGLDVVEYASDSVMIFPKRWARPFHRAERRLAKYLPWWSFSHIAVVRKSD